MFGDRQQLVEDLSKQGLGRIAEAIVAQTKLAIGIRANAADERALAIGASKLGGLPDLLENTPWPSIQGRPLSFIAQIDLMEVRTYDKEHLLPPQGILSFFSRIRRNILFDNEADHLDAIVLHNGTLSALRRKELPRDLTALTSSNMSYSRAYQPCQILFYEKLTLPDVDARSIRGLDMTTDERDAYIDIYLGRIDSVEGETAPRSHQLLGHPRQLEFDPRISCYLESTGHTVDEWTSSTPQEQEESEREAEKWQLLLQVDSDPQADMIWETMGSMYYCIAVEDLQAERFDRIQSTMEFV